MSAPALESAPLEVDGSDDEGLSPLAKKPRARKTRGGAAKESNARVGKKTSGQRAFERLLLMDSAVKDAQVPPGGHRPVESSW